MVKRLADRGLVMTRVIVTAPHQNLSAGCSNNFSRAASLSLS